MNLKKKKKKKKKKIDKDSLEDGRKVAITEKERHKPPLGLRFLICQYPILKDLTKKRIVFPRII